MNGEEVIIGGCRKCFICSLAILELFIAIIIDIVEAKVMILELIHHWHFVGLFIIAYYLEARVLKSLGFLGIPASQFYFIRYIKL